MDDKKLFLLDAYALIYRAYYAMIRSPRINNAGLNTSAIFGFCNTLDEVLRKENPQYLAVCFDPPHGRTFRHEAYEEYKANREKQPEDITLAIPYIKEILAAMRIPVIEVENFEADDVIGTLAQRAEREGFITYMMTPDKDYGQLVTDRILQYRPSLGGKGFEVRDPKAVCEKYGIESPRQVIDILALEGDKSDNIPGCPGIGEKGAAELIRQWGSVENMIEHVSEISGARQRKIADNAELIKFSKFLATIKTDVPVDVALDDLIRREPDVPRLEKVYRELGFRTFLSRMSAQEILDKQQDTAPATTAPAQGSLFDMLDRPAEEAPAPVPVVAEVTPVRAAAEVAKIVTRAMRHDTVAIYLDADGDEAMTATWRRLALAFGDEQACVTIPDDEVSRAEIAVLLEPLFNTPAVTIVSHDVKRDRIILRRAGISWLAPFFDTSVAHYLLKPEMKHTFDYAVLDVLGYQTSTYAMGDAERRRYVPKDTEICTYAAFVARMMPLLRQAIDREGLTALLDEIEMPFVSVLADMEWEGARIDVSELAQLSISYTARLDELTAQAYALAGHEFKVNSPAQVGEILFGEMKIDPKARKTKTGAWSTTEEVLEKFRHQYPIVDIILKIRALRKLLTTYVDALPKLINPETGKIHTTYNQTITATGRISSTNPNLQNIPIRSDDGREIRRAFVPDPGCVMLSADYSQIELRLIADLSGDPDMIEAFRSGEDIHRATAAKIYHIPLDEVTDNQRRNAKTANFGIIYGISAFGLSERLDIPRSEAKMLIDGYLATYPGVKRYMDESIERARQQGYVTTIRGRRRYLPDINSHNATVRGYAERNAINAPLQGSAADIIKIAMINIDAEIRRLGLRSRMIMQVHDELIFNVFPDELPQVEELVTRLMPAAYRGQIPLEVSAGVGPNWLAAH